jgi:nucleoside-triphosphatase THEP1
MTDQRVTIVTGPIDSGKTSWCRAQAAGMPDCAGVLLLKVFAEGRRIGYDALGLPASETVPFARLAGEQPSGWRSEQQVGPFSISAAGLRAANAWLFQAASRPREILVDEAGPLEIAGGGMAPGLRAVLGSAVPQKVYLVVRSGCVAAVCRRFGIRGYRLVDLSAGVWKS